jgi:hypothetical protein
MRSCRMEVCCSLIYSFKMLYIFGATVAVQQRWQDSLVQVLLSLLHEQDAFADGVSAR